MFLFFLSLTQVYGYIRDDCFCGIANYEGRRITNGAVSKPFQYPWMVVLIDGNKKPYCGGDESNLAQKVN